MKSAVRRNRSGGTYRRGAIRAASRFNSPLRGKLVPCKGQLLTQRVNKALRQGSARLRERSRGKRAGERTLERALLGPATPTSVSPHAARWSERATRDRRLGLSALPYQPKFCLLYGRECADQSAGGRALRRLIGCAAAGRSDGFAGRLAQRYKRPSGQLRPTKIAGRTDGHGYQNPTKLRLTTSNCVRELGYHP